MPRTVQALAIVHGVAFVFLGYTAGLCFSHGSWPWGVAFYAAAVPAAVAAFREYDRAATGRAYAVCEARPQPGTAVQDAEAIAAEIAHSELAEHCRCDRWWATAGTDHDLYCPERKATP